MSIWYIFDDDDDDDDDIPLKDAVCETIWFK